VTVSVPLVRTEDGAILGADYRRIPGMAKLDTVVPGFIPAKAVAPGDTLRFNGEDVLVITTRSHGRPGTVYVGTRTAGGAEIVYELRDTERVHVVAAGAFDQ
jgi:hypothetical protein